MNVYRVSAVSRNKDGVEEYTGVMSTKAADRFLRREDFQGKAFSRPWKAVRLYLDEPMRSKPDFYSFTADAFVCNEKAKALTGAVLEKYGEFLPVRIEGAQDAFYIYNVTNCLEECVNLQDSIWKHDSDEPEDPEQHKEWKKRKEKAGFVLFRTLVAPAFHPAIVRKKQLFKIQQDWGRKIYCVEEEKASPGHQFKTVVEQNNLTGLRFELAWNERRGPIPDLYPPLKNSYSVWKTGDGMKYEAK